MVAMYYILFSLSFIYIGFQAAALWHRTYSYDRFIEVVIFTGCSIILGLIVFSYVLLNQIAVAS